MMLSRRTRIGPKMLNGLKRGISSLVKDKAYINGSWVRSGETFDVKNPFNGKVIATVPNLGQEATGEAIDAAFEAFKTWRLTTGKERSNLLRKLFELCQENQEELAKVLTSEQGKPLAESKGEIGYGNGYIEWFAEEARRVGGDIIQSPTRSKQMLFVREPVGVAGIITPWNFPNGMLSRKLGAALAAGCTTVIKPAEDTPLSALALAALAERAGIPKGVINVVTSDRASEVGQAMCRNPKVAAMSFTGSTRVGKILYEQSAGTVKKLSLELGGNAPFIVFGSADVDLAVEGCMVSKFRNSGQTCVSTNRVLVHDSIHDSFVQKLKLAVEKMLVLGDGMDNGVNQGPLVNEKQFERVCRTVDEAVARGAKVVTGGSKHNIGDLFYKPTILTETTGNMSVVKEEIFGPVVSVRKFRTEDEAVGVANDCRAGLAGYFYSSDIGQCWRVAKNLEVGMVGINEGLISGPEIPFGGVKESGLGREGSKYGLDEYTEMKYICFGNL